MSRGKTRRTVCTEVNCQQITAVVIVGYTTQKRGQRPCGSRRTASILIQLIGGTDGMNIGIRLCQVETCHPRTVILCTLLGSPSQNRKVMFVE